MIIYLDARTMYSIVLEKNKVFQTTYGALKHDDVIGSEYGTRVKCSRGWVYLLFLTPELWTLTLPHRTQILYTPDISLIILQLDLKPGAIVCEAGTGSGSLSHAIARAIYPNGFLHTFDFHEQRVDIVHKEFVSHGLQDVVSVRHRDVCAEGFGVCDIADAVFLDLPRPWDVIPFANEAIKAGGRLCSFSPCIEQVQRTCESLRKHGFQDIATMECLQRKFDVKRLSLPVLKMPEKVSDAGLSNNIDGTEGRPPIESSDCEVKELEVEDMDCQPVPDTTAVGDSGTTGEKILADSSAHVAKKIKVDSKSQTSAATENVSFWTALPPLQMATHTGYLTFATSTLT